MKSTFHGNKIYPAPKTVNGVTTVAKEILCMRLRVCKKATMTGKTLLDTGLKVVLKIGVARISIKVEFLHVSERNPGDKKEVGVHCNC